jgi:hypothetical protein
VTLRKEFIFYGEETTAPRWRIAPSRLWVTANSIYLQLSSTARGRLYPQPEDAPCRGDKGPACHDI